VAPLPNPRSATYDSSVRATSLEELRAALTESGNRVTAPRRAVWQVISESDEHLTAEEIATRARQVDPGINLSSVYRSLALFAELGLARESTLEGGGASHWETAHSDDHFHLRCRLCGRVDHHEGDTVSQVRDHLRSGHGFLAEQIELVVTGLCPSCSSG
jgi:Fur family transcriptional regulator, ferric uptake regulator